MHNERGLHTHHGAIAAIDALNLASSKPIGDVAEPGAAIVLRNRRAEEPKAAHLRQDLAIETLFEIVLPRAREQVSLRERAGGVAHELFIFRELAVEIERIIPGEGSRGLAFLCHLLFSHTLRPSCVRSNAGSRAHMYL